MQKYAEYRKLDKSMKEKRISNARISELNRKPNPQGIHQFNEMNPFPLKVEEDNKIINLHTYQHVPSIEPVGVIFLFHGLNSHLGEAAHLAHYFGEKGFYTVGFDHRGFGRSEGAGGYMDSFEAHLKDCRVFLDEVMPRFEKLPKFGLGQSMGGMTVYHLTLKNPDLFDGVILMAPALKNLLGNFVVSITSFLAKILPKKTKLLKTFHGRSSRNPAITQATKQDQYHFSQRSSLSTLSTLVDVMDKSPSTFKSYKAPFIVFQGGLDKTIHPEGAFELYDQSATSQEDKEIHFYEEMWHDIWHEQEIHEIMQITEQWMLKRIKEKGTFSDEKMKNE